MDTGVTYSVTQGKLSQEIVNIIGVTGKLEKQIFFNPIKFGKQWITHQFLYMPVWFFFSEETCILEEYINII